ncbi:MAG: antibiotic biosynthesis monooxygenase family protein [Marinosulfonomonas sp.]
MTDFAPLPDPPYYAVIFASKRSDIDAGYGAMAEKMEQLARQQPGFLGVEASRDANGFGITISYWADEDSIKAWKNVSDHKLAQKYGRERWYKHFSTRVARVERQYEGP